VNPTSSWHATRQWISLPAEIFYERKLRDLSPNYDFLSIRAGSQRSTRFPRFHLTDTNLGVRVFGNYASNRYQYNAAIFDAARRTRTAASIR